MSEYIYLGDIPNWSLSNPEVQLRIREVLGEDWQQKFVPAAAGMDGIWFELID